MKKFLKVSTDGDYCTPVNIIDLNNLKNNEEYWYLFLLLTADNLLAE